MTVFQTGVLKGGLGRNNNNSLDFKWVHIKKGAYVEIIIIALISSGYVEIITIALISSTHLKSRLL